jgi:hypothetical protein
MYKQMLMKQTETSVSHKVVLFILTPCYHAIITILSVVKFALYYIILEESVYFYNPDHVKSDYFYRKGLSINCCLIYVKS